MGHEKREKIMRQEIKTMIDLLIYTNEESKSIYRQQLSSSTNSTQLSELKEIIETGERQLRKIKKSLFQTFAAFIWEINAFEYLPIMEKNHWIDALSTSTLQEEMEDIYEKAFEAEKHARLDQFDDWSILR